MKKEPRSLLRIIFGRTALLALFVIIQIVLLLVLFVRLEQFIPYAYAAFTALGVVTVIFLISGKDDASIKLSWVIPLLAVPVFGTLFYLFSVCRPGENAFTGGSGSWESRWRTICSRIRR